MSSFGKSFKPSETVKFDLMRIQGFANIILEESCDPFVIHKIL